MKTSLEDQAQTIRATITLLEKIVEYHEKHLGDDGVYIKLTDKLNYLYVAGTCNNNYYHDGLKNLIAALKETNDRLVLSAEKMT